MKASGRRHDTWGDEYCFYGICATTKIIPTYVVGKRDTGTALEFMGRLKNKLKGNGRITLVTDAFRGFLSAVPQTFGKTIDYAQVIKVYESEPAGAGRYAPPRVREVVSKIVAGNPDPRYVSTSYAERANLTLRTSLRRYTRLALGFSKKLENLKAALAVYFAAYNFVTIHGTLKKTPAHAAGITSGALPMSALI